LNPDAGASGFLGNWKLDLDLLAVRSRGIGSTIHAHGERNNADNRENNSTDSFHELDITMFGSTGKILKLVSKYNDAFKEFFALNPANFLPRMHSIRAKKETLFIDRPSLLHTSEP
jgi:hypothetical protein